MGGNRPKRPRDTNQLAHAVVKVSLEGEPDPNEGKNLGAVELGSRGGKARAEKLDRSKRGEIARKAAQTRWAAKADQSNDA